MRFKHWILLAGLSGCSSQSYALICSVTGVQSVNFGSVNPLASGTTTTTMTFGYNCARELFEIFANYATLCFNIGASANTGQVTPRSMSYAGPPASKLNYQLYRGTTGTIWGSQYQAGTSPAMINITLPPSGPTSGNLTLTGSIATPQVTAAPGAYQDTYSNATATVTSNTNFIAPPSSCGNTPVANFSFNVIASIAKQCNVTANGDINLGAVSANTINTNSNNSINVSCSNSTPYTIGLQPSNGNLTGSGMMKTTSTGSDQVAYQLSSTPGPSGTVWGSSATNTVAGIGNGSATSYNVYANVPSANYAPGNYSDTVTIDVTY